MKRGIMKSIRHQWRNEVISLGKFLKGLCDRRKTGLQLDAIWVKIRNKTNQIKLFISLKRMLLTIFQADVSFLIIGWAVFMSQKWASSSTEICHKDWCSCKHELTPNKKKKRISWRCQGLITETQKQTWPNMTLMRIQGHFGYPNCFGFKRE